MISGDLRLLLKDFGAAAVEPVEQLALAADDFPLGCLKGGQHVAQPRVCAHSARVPVECARDVAAAEREVDVEHQCNIRGAARVEGNVAQQVGGEEVVYSVNKPRADPR